MATEPNPIVSDPPAEPPADPPAEPAAEPPKGNGAAAVESNYPENWRELMAGDDAKELKQLQRYDSPNAIWRKARAFEQRLSSGELRSALPKDAGEEEVQRWREENGIPTKPTDYDLTFDDGLVIGDDDKPIIDAYLNVAHESNLSPEQVKNNIRWYYEEQERQTEAREAQDQKITQEAEDTLRAEWGPEFRANMNRIQNFMSLAPGDISEKILSGRMSDGTPIGSDPDTLRWLVGLARERDPTGTLVGGTGGDPLKTIQDRLNEINNALKTDRARYDREGMADEKAKLLESLDLQQRRAG